MRIIDCQQGTPEWTAARIGIPTASCFDQIVTPSGGASKSADRYLARLAAEWFLGQPLEDYQSGFMQRGSDMEASAVAWYEFEKEADVRAVGFCVRDDGKAGASPDRLVGDDGLLEIKCPSAEVHMSYVLGGPPTQYHVQVQGQLWITGRAWCDLLCYHPTFPRVCVRVQRSPEFIDTLEAAMGPFIAKLDMAKVMLADDRRKYHERRDAESLDQVPAGIS